MDAQCNKLATVEQLHNTAVVNVPWRKKEKSQLNSEMWPVFLCVTSVLTMAADDQSEISFSIPQGTLLWQRPLRDRKTNYYLACKTLFITPRRIYKDAANCYRPPNAFLCNSQPKICKICKSVKSFDHLHKTPIQHSSGVATQMA